MHHYHASYSPLLVLMSFLVSVCGSFMALKCASHARKTTGAARGRWNATAAVGLGGCAIWAMHFIGISAYSIDSAIRFDWARTIVSLVAAVLVAGLALHFTADVTRGVINGRLLIAGFLTGMGVVLMHYLGMSAMRTRGHIEYSAPLVAASVVIAVVAATVALWLMTNLEGTKMMAVAAVVMGVAVCGMHYTGMFAAKIRIDSNVRIGGATDTLAVGIVTAFVVFIIMVPVLYVSFTAESDSARRSDSRRFTSGRRVADGTGA